MGHRSDLLYFALGKTKPVWGWSEEHRVFTQQVGTEGESIVGLGSWDSEQPHEHEGSKDIRRWQLDGFPSNNIGCGVSPDLIQSCTWAVYHILRDELRGDGNPGLQEVRGEADFNRHLLSDDNSLSFLIQECRMTQTIWFEAE
jgi:hypothetical protein